MILPRKITILVDTREQKPLPLPKTIKWSEVGKSAHIIEIRQEPITLDAGDYMIKGAGKSCVVERKGSINELHQNLQGPDRPRAMRAFQKLVESTQNPILALDFPLSQRLYKGDRETVFTRLMQLCATYRISILSVGGGLNARHLLSDLIIRVLLAHYLTAPGKDLNVCQNPTKPLLQSRTSRSSTSRDGIEPTAS